MEGEADHILATHFLPRFVGGTPWLYINLSGHSCKSGLGAVMSDANGFGVAWGITLLQGLQAQWTGIGEVPESREAGFGL